MERPIGGSVGRRRSPKRDRIAGIRHPQQQETTAIQAKAVVRYVILGEQFPVHSRLNKAKAAQRAGAKRSMVKRDTPDDRRLGGTRVTQPVAYVRINLLETHTRLEDGALPGIALLEGIGHIQEVPQS